MCRKMFDKCHDGISVLYSFLCFYLVKIVKYNWGHNVNHLKKSRNICMMKTMYSKIYILIQLVSDVTFITMFQFVPKHWKTKVVTMLSLPPVAQHVLLMTHHGAAINEEFWKALPAWLAVNLFMHFKYISQRRHCSFQSCEALYMLSAYYMEVAQKHRQNRNSTTLSM